MKSDAGGCSLKVELEFSPMSGFGGGFRTPWVSAKGDGLEAGIDSGAGLGNGYITFWIEKDGGKRKFFTAPIENILAQLIDLIDKKEVVE